MTTCLGSMRPFKASSNIFPSSIPIFTCAQTPPPLNRSFDQLQQETHQQQSFRKRARMCLFQEGPAALNASLLP